ncbi:MAG: ABC transporter ATP-binding protein/permease [Planctomycetia bacterium]|nr:ABC transporter ATP-binding protein/permease [Planctomycetia bacterium]
MASDPHAKSESIVEEFRTIAYRVRQMWKLIPQRQKLTLGAAGGIIFLGGAANTAIPLLLGALVDTVEAMPIAARNAAGETPLPDGFLRSAGMYMALIGAAYLLREALQVARRYIVEDTTTRLEKHLFIRVITQLLTADLSSISQEKIGVLHGRMLRSVAGGVRFLRLGFLDFLPALLSGGLALTAVVAKEPWLGLAMTAVVPLSLYITLRQIRSQEGVRLDLMRSREQMDGTVVEQLNGIEYIRAADTHLREVERVAKAAENLRRKELRHHFEMSLYGSSKALGEALVHICVLGAAVYLAAKGEISVGSVFTFSMLFLNVMAPLNEVHRVVDEGHESSLMVADLLQMLNQESDRSYRTAPRAADPAYAGDLIIGRELDVDYATPAYVRRGALSGVSLSIARGEIIGIAGRSGCGKSTLLKTLMRLVHPGGGEALLEGIPLDETSRASIARLTGYVSQAPFIFSGTITENIAYERQDATPEQIRRAAEMACLHDEIMAMPGGYEARVAERGKNLSGGQQQRLALARVFLKDPALLILDEATSALDNISERKIQQALNNGRRDRTILLVAHRLSTLLYADRILVFDGGKIVETGTYDELVALGGVFTELVRSATGFDHPTDDAALSNAVSSNAAPNDTAPKDIPLTM